MDVIPLDLSNKRQTRDFLDLPFSIYRDIPQWVPPLLTDERLRLNPKRFPFYRHSRAAFFLAYEGTRPLGRIAVLDNRNYNDYNREATAFFHLFECEDNLPAASALFEAAFAWARSRGLNKILGPKGFTPLDGFGLLVKGFDLRPALGLPYNPEYYVRLVEAQGFVNAGESVSGCLDANIRFPPRIHELAERVASRRGLRVARYAKRSDLRALVPRLKELYNNALRDTTGNAPLTDDEAKALAGQLLWFADPKLIKIVMKDDQPVGFLFAYPDISAALQKNARTSPPLRLVDSPARTQTHGLPQHQRRGTHPRIPRLGRDGHPVQRDVQVHRRVGTVPPRRGRPDRRRERKHAARDGKLRRGFLQSPPRLPARTLTGLAKRPNRIIFQPPNQKAPAVSDEGLPLTDY